MRSYAILRALARRHEVTLVTLGDGSQDQASVREMCARVVVVPSSAFQAGDFPPRLASTRLGRLVYVFSSPRPLEFRRVRADALCTAVEEAARPAFDLHWIVRLQVARALPSLDAAKTVVDLDDLEHVKRLASLRRMPFYPLKFSDYLEWCKLRWYERHVIGRYGAALVCSEDDRRRLNAPNVRVLPNGIDLPVFAGADVPEQPDTILFPGDMSYPPNIEAVCLFCRDILPHIRTRRARSTFVIAGRAPAPVVRTLHNGVDVVVTGPVADMAPFFRASALVVVPLHVGGGTRIKILEAFARRKAVVSTSLGAAGLDVRDGTHLYLADSPHSFADACVRLLEDARERRRLGDNGYNLVCARYDWQVLEPIVLEVADEVASHGRKLSYQAA